MEELLKAIATGLKYDADQFLADFKNGDDFLPEKEVAQKLGGLISEKVKAANETAKKIGRSEVNKRFSRLIKDSGFDNGEGLEGEPLFSAFLEWKGEQGGANDGDPKAMSKEELLKLPAVKSIVQEVGAKAGEKWAGERKDFEAKMQAAENTRKRILLNKYLAETSERAKINLGETAEQKALRLDFLLSRIDVGRLQVDEKDALKYLDADGYETDLEKEFLPIAQTAFGVITQDKNRGGSGAQGSGAAGQNGGGEKYTPTFTFPGGSADFDKMVMSAKDNAERHQMHKDWKFQRDSELAAGK